MSAEKITAKCADALDKVLFEYNLEFRHADQKWEEFGEQLVALIYRYYDDNGTSDSTYDPDASSPSREEVTSSESASQSLSEGEPAPKRR